MCEGKGSWKRERGCGSYRYMACLHTYTGSPYESRDFLSNDVSHVIDCLDYSSRIFFQLVKNTETNCNNNLGNVTACNEVKNGRGGLECWLDLEWF